MSELKRQLGVLAVTAVVAGDMLGSGIFFTPGALAPVAQANWQVYFLWALCGFITLCGALTLAELSSLFPKSGASFHIIGEAFGPFWAFVKIWVEALVGGPGSIAAVAIAFGDFVSNFLHQPSYAVVLGIIPICLFTAINLLGVRWGGWTQVVLTAIKLAALITLVLGSFLLASPNQTWKPVDQPFNIAAFLRVVGLGVAVVLYTFDGWIDVTHVAGEVAEPKRTLPRGLSAGVLLIVLLYLLVNYAYLRIVPLEEMRKAPLLVASTVATKTYGVAGGTILTGLITVSILGALGGLVMTFPRLVFSVADEYHRQFAGKKMSKLFGGLASVSTTTAVPYGAILFTGAFSILIVLAFQSFNRVANFLVVSLQFINMLLIASIFRLHRRTPETDYKTPGYPVTPLIFITVMGLFILSAVVYAPRDTLIGIALTSTAVPVYFWLNKKPQTNTDEHK